MRIKNYLSGLLFCLFLNSTSGQQLNTDSLLSLLKTTSHDTTKLDLLFKMVENIYDEKVWAPYNQQAYVLSQELLQSNNPKIKARAEAGLAESINNTGLIYFNKGDIPMALENFNKALSLYEKTQNKNGIFSTLTNIGGVYEMQGSIDKALRNYERSLLIGEEKNDKRIIAGALNNIGVIYTNQGNILKALEYLQRSLKLKEELKDKQGVANALNNLGAIYSKQGDLDKAMEYWQRSLSIFRELKDNQSYGMTLNNLGVNYVHKGELSKSLEYHKKAYSIREMAGDKRGTAESLENIAMSYSTMGDFPKALEYSLRSLSRYKEIDDKLGIAHSLSNIGSNYLKQKNYSMALDYGDSALVASKELGYPDNIRNAANLLNKIYRDSQKWDKALEMYDLYIVMRDSVNNEETRKAGMRKQMQYEYENKEALLEEQQNKKDAMATAEKRKQQIITWSVVFGLLLVVVFAAAIFRSLRITSKQKVLIEIKNKETQEQKELIEQQKEVVEEKQKEILDSINYAKRIQYALLASNEILKANLNEHFVYFNPKDIVSGDFYWATKKADKFYLAVCDSTGHGVPGAFMSLLNISFLNEAINEKNIVAPNEVLNHVRQRLIENMDGGQDGMDAVLICIEKNKISYAAANNALVIIKNGELIHLDADKMPVGKGERTDSFTLRSVEAGKNDLIYLYTDGYADQFGGPKGKKFKYKPLNELLLSAKDTALSEQRRILEESFNAWKGNIEQVDDVLLIGIKV